MEQKSFHHKIVISFIVYLITGLFFLYFVTRTNAEVRINEIYPAPKSGSGETEWIELYNDEKIVIDLTSYVLIDKANNQIKITSQNIAPYGFIIETATVLNNDGDTVYLKNNSIEVEQVSYTDTFDEKKSFIRCPDGNGSWFTSTIQTKQASNQDACVLLAPTPTNTPPTITPPTETAQPTSTPSPTTIPVSHNNIFISEIMPYPEDNNEEWIEVYNNNDSAVSLDNWHIDDGENTGSSPKSFTIAIPSKQYTVIDLSSSIFNNDGDIVRLLDFNKTEKDAFSYAITTKGKTYGRTSFSSRDFCQQNPTKGTNNSGCIGSESEKTPTPTPSQTPTPTSIQTIAPSQSPQITTTLSLSQTQIIVDTEPNREETISSDAQSLPSHGSVLSAETEYDKTQKQRKTYAYVLGLSSSSALISLVNIGNIVRKIIQRLKI